MLKFNLKTINLELSSVFELIDEDKAQEIVNCIIDAKRIFIAGVGRSGLMMKAFAMRLMHFELEVYVIGDVTTPSAAEGDLLIVGSGSGETGSLKVYADKAKKLGLKLITLTSFVDSYLGEIADVTLQIPAPTPKSSEISNIASKQPMGNLYEQSLMICLDALVMELMEKKLKNSNEMFGNHANLE